MSKRNIFVTKKQTSVKYGKPRGLLIHQNNENLQHFSKKWIVQTPKTAGNSETPLHRCKAWHTNRKPKNTHILSSQTSLCLCWILPIASAWTSGQSQDHPWVFAVLCRPYHRFSHRHPFLIQLLVGEKRRLESEDHGTNSRTSEVSLVTGDVYRLPFWKIYITLNMSCLHHRGLQILQTSLGNMCKKVNTQRYVCVCVQNPKPKNE